MARDYEIKEKISSKEGIGISFKGNDETTYQTIIEGKRRVSLSITSWIGTAVSWAKHYYASFNYYSLNVKVTAIPKTEKYHKVGDKLGLSCNTYPEKAKGKRIEITRILDKDLIEADGYKWNKGDRTESFESITQLKKRILEEVNRLFDKEEWEVNLSELENFEEELKLEAERGKNG